MNDAGRSIPSRTQFNPVGTGKFGYTDIPVVVSFQALFDLIFGDIEIKAEIGVRKFSGVIIILRRIIIGFRLADFSYPCRVFKAKVRLLIDAVAGGQLQSTGTLVNVGGPLAGDRALAILDIKDDISGYQIPLGAAGEAAIYTEHFHELSLLRKILLRMRSWQNYAFFEAG